MDASFVPFITLILQKTLAFTSIGAFENAPLLSISFSNGSMMYNINLLLTEVVYSVVGNLIKSTVKAETSIASLLINHLGSMSQLWKST
jgi:hypothetical protein